MPIFSETKALTFDLFGTILNLGGSLTPFIREGLNARDVTEISADDFWEQWRYRQRIEQYQDTIMMLGHSGYLETVRLALHYTLRRNGIEASPQTVEEFMKGWQCLSPFPEVLPALQKLKDRYSLVVLSNGDPEFLDYLAKDRVKWDFDDVISVTSFGAFKPHPAVYRGAAGELGIEVNTCLMVSANSFDIMGARACGYRGAFVNRYNMPYEDTQYQADVTVNDFSELAEALQ
ncbi:haloacid dehalogenase type II [Candidatus Poribacteria bacterium]|nr:haloacid dehalogenase type II [Candidatus Poribacteria bacterium]MYB64667.1 haloacid dehalogenase type II [Candidatus Poribacteria bacterium]MYF54992.1 haloacid dehalogenase type II [Candidatus Poribacteria bacterium]